MIRRVWNRVGEIMEDIKVGEYVRTKEGKIGKITEIEGDLFEFENGIGYFSFNDYKFSSNIIDLIEVKDVIEGVYIPEAAYARWFINDDSSLKALKEMVAEKSLEIKSVVTREQMDSMKYVVGDKE